MVLGFSQSANSNISMLYRVFKKFGNRHNTLVKTDKQQYVNNIILIMWLNNLPDKCASALSSVYL